MGKQSVGRRLEVTGSVLLGGRGRARRASPGDEELDATLCRQKAELFRALGQPVRLRVVEALSEGELTVTQLAQRTRSGLPNLSKHLALLRRVGLVESRKEGLNVFYRLKLRCITSFFTCVTEAVREQAEEAVALARRL